MKKPVEKIFNIKYNFYPKVFYYNYCYIIIIKYIRINYEICCHKYFRFNTLMSVHILHVKHIFFPETIALYHTLLIIHTLSWCDSLSPSQNIALKYEALEASMALWPCIVLPSTSNVMSEKSLLFTRSDRSLVSSDRGGGGAECYNNFIIKCIFKIT